MPSDDLKAALLAEASTVMAETRQAVLVVGDRMSALEAHSAREVAELRSHMDGEFEEIRQKMGTMNAHLDNIAREASIANAHHDRTNELLEKDLKERQVERKRQLDLDEARLKHEQLLTKEKLVASREDKAADREDKRLLQDRLSTAASEAWSVFKQPLAYLVVAVVGYVAWYFFGAPPPTHQIHQPIESQVEADE